MPSDMTASVNENQPKILTLRPRNNGTHLHIVRQEDILELMMRSQELSAARERYERQRDMIKAALEMGADIEDGALTVELKETAGGGSEVRAYTYKRLVVRGRA